MGLGSRIGGTLRVPGGGARRSLVVFVVLVLAAATGSAVALSAPALVADLEVEQQTGPIAVPDPVLGPLPLAAPQPTPAGVAEILDPLAAAAGLDRFSGVVLDAVTGAPLWESMPDRTLIPGSATKLLTGAAVMLTLDPTDGFVTRAVAGAEPGTVVLVGGGDPTLTALPAGEEGVYPEPARLTELAEEVRAAVTGPVERVVVDTSRYSGPVLAPGWDPRDVTAGFVAPIVPLMLDGARVEPRAQDGARVAEPALAAGEAFAELLDADEVTEGVAPAQSEVLGAVASAPVSVLVEHVVRTSDNVLAEALAREVAIAREAPASFEGAARETIVALDQAGFSTTGTVLVDGSGLSTQNLVPARLLGALLAAAAAPVQDGGTQFLRPLVTGLPVAGGDGTLDDRFDAGAGSAAGRGVVRAKTGTLTNVTSLAGVVTDADGRLLVFAFMSNGVSPPIARAALDEMATALAGCGCR